MKNKAITLSLIFSLGIMTSCGIKGPPLPPLKNQDIESSTAAVNGVTSVIVSADTTVPKKTKNKK